MSIQQTEFIRFIKLLSDNGCMEHVILVGSWAEYLYHQKKLLKEFTPAIKTLDIDFLIKNMRKPNPPRNVAFLAKDAGYLIRKDVLTGVTQIMDLEGLEIEFLINKVGAGTEQAVSTNLGVTAQSLRHMGILLNHTLTVDFLGMKITVPEPEAYTLHKIVINEQRGKKQEKDRQAICNLWNHLDNERLKALYTELTVREKKSVTAFLSANALTYNANR